MFVVHVIDVIRQNSDRLLADSELILVLRQETIQIIDMLQRQTHRVMRKLALLLLLEDILQRQVLDFSEVDELVEEVPHFVFLHFE